MRFQADEPPTEAGVAGVQRACESWGASPVVGWSHHDDRLKDGSRQGEVLRTEPHPHMLEHVQAVV